MSPVPPSPTPPPDPSPQSPSPSDAPASSNGSQTGSSRASAPAGFVADPGSFDPGRAAERGERVAQEMPAQEPAEIVPYIEWDRDQVRDFLVAQGAAVHAVAGKSENDWVYTEAELVALSGPLTRVLNRYDVTRAAAGAGDELALALGFGAYAGRSWQERMQALRELEAQPEVPVSGVAPDDPAPPGEPIDPAEVDWNTGR